VAEATEKLDYIDALRGIAIIGVVIVHVGKEIGLTGLDWHLAYFGQRGVQLFFIVSAFTLCRSADRARTVSWSGFFIRRFFRIVPMFYLAILLNFALYRCGVTRDFSLKGALAAMVFLNGFSMSQIMQGAIGGWTVADEANFYMVFPLIYTCFRSLRSLLWLCLGLALIVLSISIKMALVHNDVVRNAYYMFLWPPIEAPVFLLGLIAHRTLNLGWVEGLSPAQSGVLSAVLLAVAGAIFVGIFPSTNENLYPCSIGLCLAVLAIALRPWPVFVNRFTRFTGRISYSVYLLHFYAVMLVAGGGGYFTNTAHPAALRFGLALLAVMLITWPACTLTQRYIEAPCIALGKHLAAAASTEAG